MKRKIVLSSMLVLLVALAAVPAFARGGGPLKRVTVYVRSTRLSYDSIVTTDLPQQGKFQELFPTMNGLETDFGPGDPGYLGGRWWVDENKNGVQDEGDSFFLCPLLGPGQ
ncbi:MAG: hypothetical protein IIC78_01605 [Chloroflexi bacterium]|nr:hypothetical protein [Chloroflexota bacterium]